MYKLLGIRSVTFSSESATTNRRRYRGPRAPSDPAETHHLFSTKSSDDFEIVESATKDQGDDAGNYDHSSLQPPEPFEGSQQLNDEHEEQVVWHDNANATAATATAAVNDTCQESTELMAEAGLKNESREDRTEKTFAVQHIHSIQHRAGKDEIVAKVDAMSAQVNGISATHDQIETLREQFDCDIRSLKNQVELQKMQIAELEERRRLDQQTIDVHIAAFRDQHENEVAELRQTQQRHDVEIRNLREQLNQRHSFISSQGEGPEQTATRRHQEQGRSMEFDERFLSQPRNIESHMRHLQYGTRRGDCRLCAIPNELTEEITCFW